jgi:hypothetical protein
MKPNDLDEARLIIQKEKRLNGLLFGLAAGFFLALGIWGFDALQISMAHAEYPWAKFALGLPFTLLVAGLAGWLTARLDNAFLGALVWLIAGLATVWVASHVPFQGVTMASGLLQPAFAGLEIYPFVISIKVRMELLYVVVGLLTALGGGFELFFVEAATRASHTSGRLFWLLASLIIFLPIGLAVDNLINQALRIPVLAVHDVLQAGLRAEKGLVSKDEARGMGLSAITPFGDLIHQPYRLSLGQYDPQTMVETSVYIDFGGQWGVCYVMATQPVFCQMSGDRYVSRLACALKQGQLEACDLNSTPGSEQNLAEILQDTAGKDLTFGILGQRGQAVVLLVSTGQGKTYRCTLLDEGYIYFDSCKSSAAVAFTAVGPSPTHTPAPATTQRPVTLTSTPTATAAPAISAARATEAVPTSQPAADLSFLSQVPKYTIQLKLDFPAPTFQGQQSVSITNTQTTALNELYFRLLPNGQLSYGDGALTVQQVKVGGQAVQNELSEKDSVLKVTLPQPLDPGQHVQVDLAFQGQVPQDFGHTAATSGYGIYNQSDNVLVLANWYPILAVYDSQGWNLDPVSYIGDSVFSEMAYYTVTISAPQELVIATTGIQAGQQVEDQTATTRFTSGPTRDFFIAASPDFKSTSKVFEGTTINSWYLPGNEQAAEQALSIAATSLGIYNDKFGSYPYPELDVVETPLRYALGVEYPGIVLIAKDLYKDPERPEFAVATAHEVAHQWWYNVVGNNVFDEPWLDEAMATYSSSLYYEDALGPAYVNGLVSSWQQRYTKLVQEGKDDLVTQTLAHFESLNDPAGVYGGVVYSKGALFFSALRQEIGDQAFFKGLWNYYHAEEFRVATAKNLLDAFEQASGRDLQAFYQQWLYSSSDK